MVNEAGSGEGGGECSELAYWKVIAADRALIRISLPSGPKPPTSLTLFFLRSTRLPVKFARTFRNLCFSTHRLIVSTQSSYSRR